MAGKRITRLPSRMNHGTIKLIARAAVMEEALKEGGLFVLFVIDEIESRLHPILVEYWRKTGFIGIFGSLPVSFAPQTLPQPLLSRGV